MTEPEYKWKVLITDIRPIPRVTEYRCNDYNFNTVGWLVLYKTTDRKGGQKMFVPAHTTANVEFIPIEDEEYTKREREGVVLDSSQDE